MAAFRVCDSDSQFHVNVMMLSLHVLSFRKDKGLKRSEYLLKPGLTSRQETKAWAQWSNDWR